MDTELMRRILEQVRMYVSDNETSRDHEIT